MKKTIISSTFLVWMININAVEMYENVVETKATTCERINTGMTFDFIAKTDSK